MRYFTFGDRVVAVCVVVCALLILTIFAAGTFGGGELYVEIKSNGKEYAAYPLKFEKTIAIDNEFGYNEIKIYDGKVYAIGDCEDRIESKESPIYKEGQMLVCLPHRLVVSIVSEKNDIDGVTY